MFNLIRKKIQTCDQMVFSVNGNYWLFNTFLPSINNSKKWKNSNPQWPDLNSTIRKVMVSPTNFKCIIMMSLFGYENANFLPKLIIAAHVELEILHIPILYPTDMSRSSQTMFGILRRFTFDPGISDQITEISEIGIRNHLHKKTNSTSKHHLQRITDYCR